MNRSGVSVLLGIIVGIGMVWWTDPITRGDEKPDVAAAAKKVKAIIGHRGSCADRPENTLASYRRAIEVGAMVAECDVRTTRDGVLVSSHDADIRRTSNGKGTIDALTLAELKRLDFGGWFDPKYQGERIPTLREILELCKGKIHVMLDLKESGDPYMQQIAVEVKKYSHPKEIVLGIRSVEHARTFRKLLPEARQIGLIPDTASLDAYAKAEVDAIRLWPRWLSEPTLVAAVRKHKRELLLSAPKGTREEVLAVLPYEPEWLASDDPGRLKQTLAEIAKLKK
jgi:glycerophosphoryl diester phosphodiesterase